MVILADDDDDDNDDNDGGAAQHDGHTPKNRDIQPWFTLYFFDIVTPMQ